MSRGEGSVCVLCGCADTDESIVSEAQLSRSREAFTFVRCAECKLVRLSPRPSDTELARWYDDYMLHEGAAAWGRHARTVERAFRVQDKARVRVALKGRPLGGQARVLDVGCGAPTFLDELQRRTGAEAVGLDFSDAGWRETPERYAHLKLHGTTLAKAPLEGPFDLITAWHSLEHDPSPIESLKRLRALARPGARLVVEVPDVEGWSRRIQGARWAGYHTPRHMHAFSTRTLGQMLAMAGWRIETQRRYGTLDPWVLFWLGRLPTGASVNFESRFTTFVLGKVLTYPIAWLQGFIPLGIQTAIARAD